MAEKTVEIFRINSVMNESADEGYIEVTSDLPTMPGWLLDMMADATTTVLEQAANRWKTEGENCTDPTCENETANHTVEQHVRKS